MITSFYQNRQIGLVTTERLIFVNTNKSKSMTVKACSYISSIGRVCGCVRAEGGSVTGGGAGARPQLPVLPSEVATSSSAASSHTARQPVIMSTWLAALHPLSSGSHLAPVITLTVSLLGYIISNQLHWHWLHHLQPMNGYFEESTFRTLTEGGRTFNFVFTR